MVRPKTDPGLSKSARALINDPRRSGLRRLKKTCWLLGSGCWWLSIQERTWPRPPYRAATAPSGTRAFFTIRGVQLSKPGHLKSAAGKPSRSPGVARGSLWCLALTTQNWLAPPPHRAVGYSWRSMGEGLGECQGRAFLNDPGGKEVQPLSAKRNCCLGKGFWLAPLPPPQLSICQSLVTSKKIRGGRSAETKLLGGEKNK